MDHLSQVERWLEEHVAVHPTPEVVTLKSFEVDWERVVGTFSIALDGEDVPGRFDFGLGMTGRISTSPPLFVSPLGAPCSYAAIELTDATWATIDELIAICIPRFRPYGRERATGIEVDGRTPLSARVLDSSALLRSQAILNAGFSISSKAIDV